MLSKVVTYLADTIYDVSVGSWAGILDELASEASMIISVIRYGWKNLDREDS